MSKDKFTKGPWAFRPATRYIHAGIKGARITFKVLNNQYDGYLIAAAPELYEALELCVDSLDYHGRYSLVDKALSALAKARGEK